MRILVASGLVVAALAGNQAVAQDFAGAFNGPYVGAQAGWSWYNVDVSVSGLGSDDLDVDGAEGGLYAGYGMSNGPLYGAVEVEGNLSGASETFENVLKLEANYSAGISAIIGGLVTDSALVYGRIGYEYMKAEASAFGYSEKEGFHGLRLGAGAEYAITPNIHARAEYSYTFYDQKDYTDGVDTLSIEPSESLVRIGVSYNF